jgi:ATP-dependent DNA helicase RecQ
VVVTPESILQEKFGYSEFRLEQREIIDDVLAKKDALVLMPTGGGKSLCYQIPALIFEGLTVVVSPLIALMKDQVDALNLNGIPAAYLNSTQNSGEQSHIVTRLRAGQIKLLYIAPERMFADGTYFLDFLADVNVNFFAIDEAHCISQWGHDFRPEYSMLSVLKERFPEVPVLALTATADDLTRKDILDKLQLDRPRLFVSSFNRENIHYTVKQKRDSNSKLVHFLRSRKEESGIIYVLSRKSTERLAKQLTDAGFNALPYHAGLDHATRQKNQELFIRDEVKIVVATIAFGMGIDKSNVRFVVHMDLPKNIENYYQETGRAGRDGLKSDALLFYSYADVNKLKGFVEIDGNTEQSGIMLKKLDKMAEFGQTRRCRRQFLLHYFNEEHAGNCNSCDVCLSENEMFDGTEIAQKALSAVYRLKENFGINYTIDFLRGSKSQAIKEWHKELKTYGVGAEISKNDWHQYIRNLMDIDVLKLAEGQYPILKLTTKSIPILKGEAQVKLFRIEDEEEIVEEVVDYEAELFNQLKSLRHQLAIEANVPAYVIFPDNTLVELAKYLPLELVDMDKISGFGHVKIERYGASFLEIVQAYCSEKQLETRIHLKVTTRKRKKKREKKKRSSSKSDTKAETYALFTNGISITEIASMRSLTVNTIESHLAHFVYTGELPVDKLVAKEKVPAIKSAIKTSGVGALGPIKQALGQAYSYGEIKAVMSEMKKEGEGR